MLGITRFDLSLAVVLLIAGLLLTPHVGTQAFPWYFYGVQLAMLGGTINEALNKSSPR